MKHRGIGKQINGNLSNIFWRTLLGLLYLYLNFAAYQLLGIEAVAVTSSFLLLAQFAPFFLHIYDKRKALRSARKVEQPDKPNPQQPETVVMPIQLLSRAEQESV